MAESILIIAFLFFLYKFIKNIGNTFPLFDLTAVLYLLQFGIAPILEYQFGERGSMAVDKDTYFEFALLASGAFISGLYVFGNKLTVKNIQISSDMASKLGRVFLVIGLGSSVAMLFLPESLRAIVNFFIILKWPAVFSLIFSNRKLDKMLVAIVYLEIAISAIVNALLIEFIVFSMFLIMFFTLKYKISTKIKIGTVVVGVLFLTVYQGVKAEYRTMVWENEVTFEEKIGLLSQLITVETLEESFSLDFAKNESFKETIHRLNQGWQTSMVLYKVPNVIPFENGNALLNDVLSSIAPRFVYPNKRVVNDYKRFNYYTGYNLNSKTAMTIGLLGDFYINFGTYGSMFFLFLFGMLFSKISQWFYKKFVYENAINLIWLPFLFSYLIRPGNEFYMVLNHLIKALIVFFLIRKFIYPYLSKTLNLNTPIEQAR